MNIVIDEIVKLAHVEHYSICQSFYRNSTSYGSIFIYFFKVTHEISKWRKEKNRMHGLQLLMAKKPGEQKEMLQTKQSPDRSTDQPTVQPIE